MTKFIQNVVARSTGFLVKYPRTDPPAFKTDRPFKRVVRVAPSTSATTLTALQIASTEGGYYGNSSPRWTSVKLLCATFYGSETASAIAVTMEIVGAGVATTTYTDSGDDNHRPCIKVIQPPTQSAQLVSNANSLATFAAGSIDIIDCYVEFS